MRAVVNLNAHTIGIFVSIWNGKETVSYDGEEISSRRNLWTFTSSHSFTVREAGEDVVYEVQIYGGLQPGYAVRRNGIVAAHKP